jgi:putative ABC transport system ATP-binding protein
LSLQADNVSLTLGDGDQQVRALDEVSLVVAPGELLAVVGPSGSGKTSLLAVCGGLRTPTAGRIRVGDAEITALPASRLADVRRDRIGFVFQQSNLVPALTAIDQLLLMSHMRGVRPGRAERERALGLLREVGMEHRHDRRPAQLSGGERQRVGIARALMSRPALLLVDEPTSMLDHARGRQIVDLLARECHQHQVATLMVTHDASMLDVADRVVTMADGRLAA